MANFPPGLRTSPNDSRLPRRYLSRMDDPDQSAAAARFPFDAIYKALCCHRQTVGDMLTGFLAEAAGPLPRTLVDALDLDRVRKLSMEWVTREFRLRRGDQVWEAPFKPDARRRGYPPFLLVNLEFQSRRDGLMALRFVEQGNELYRELRAQGVVAENEPCPVLCVLLHNGRSPWTAATATGELLALPPAVGVVPPMPPEAAVFHPWGYFALDFVAHRDRPHIAGNVVSMMVGIEFARDRADLVAPLWETVRNLADDELRDAVARWLRRMNGHYNMDLPGLEELLEMEDVTVLTSRLDETIEQWRRAAVTEGESRGLSQGRSEGAARQRALLGRLAAQRFGPATGERVGALLGEVADWDRLGLVGEAIVEAASGEELTRRIQALVRD